MSKVLEASAEAGVVTVEGLPITIADILSKGVGSSTGVLIIEGDKAYYLTSNADDLSDTLADTKSAIDKVVQAVNQIATSLTTLNAQFTANSLSPSAAIAAQVVAITGYATELTAIGVEMETLKEALK